MTIALIRTQTPYIHYCAHRIFRLQVRKKIQEKNSRKKNAVKEREKNDRIMMDIKHLTYTRTQQVTSNTKSCTNTQTHTAQIHTQTHTLTHSTGTYMLAGLLAHL